MPKSVRELTSYHNINKGVFAKAMATYADKVQRQIDQYSDIGQNRQVADIQELPDIFHYWSNKYVLPLIIEIFGVANVFELYSKYFADSLTKIHHNNLLLSVGCGDCSFETGVALDLIKKGETDFVFECLDISPVLVKKSQDRVASLGLEKHFNISQVDINFWSPKDIYCGVMAHQSLHHVVELEQLLENIRKALHDDGVFITSDMIGRNGHMRWPEALEIVNGIWAFMPDQLKHNRLLKRFEEAYHNHDCSKEGFEGVRSQDILPLLVKNFHFERFLAYGNIPDVFIERCFGHNFSPDNTKDKAFVDFLEFLNRLLIDLGHIKPTMMFGVMTKRGSDTICYKEWTPEYCIRPTDSFRSEARNVNRNPLRIIKKLCKILWK